MLVPKASMYKNHFSARGEHNVGLSGKVFAMQAEAVAETVNQAAERNLWARVFTANALHVSAAAFWRKFVSHWPFPY
jgi:hypothetical protein